MYKILTIILRKVYYIYMKNDLKILPISQARSRLSSLVRQVKGEEYFLLTKGGKPAAAVVDVDYLTKLQKDSSAAFEKTFVDPKLLPLTREFSNSEIIRWEKEDKL